MPIKLVASLGGYYNALCERNGDSNLGDGIMIKVMLVKKPMSELVASLKIYEQVLENARVTDKKITQNDSAVHKA